MARTPNIRIPKRYMGHAGADHQAKVKNTALIRVPGRIILFTAALRSTTINTTKSPFKISPQRDSGNSKTQRIQRQIKPSNTIGNGRALWWKVEGGRWKVEGGANVTLSTRHLLSATCYYFNSVIFLFSWKSPADMR